MIGYMMVGTNDLTAATTFYDIILDLVGLIRVYTQDDQIGYAPKAKRDEIEFYICKPFDRKIATVGNGTMVAFFVKSKVTVDRFHSAGLKLGAKNEGDPGARPGKDDPYYAYLRDLDGNKLCVYAPS